MKIKNVELSILCTELSQIPTRKGGVFRFGQ